MALTLTSDDLIAMHQTLYGGRQWYVDGATGNDSNAGTVIAPTLTVQGTHDLAEAGDTIYVRDGTYAESVVVTKRIRLIGQSRNNTKIQSSGAGTNALTLSTGSDCSYVAQLTATMGSQATDTTSQGMLILSDACLVEWLKVIGAYDGLVITSTGSIVRNTIVSGTFDGTTLTTSNDCLLENIYTTTDSSWNSGATECRALTAGTGKGNVYRHIRAIATRTNSAAFNTLAVGLANQEATLEDVIASATITNVSATQNAIAVRLSSSSGKASLRGVKTTSSTTGSGSAYDLLNSGTMIDAGGNHYSEAKISGTRPVAGGVVDRIMLFSQAL